jgi:transposase
MAPKDIFQYQFSTDEIVKLQEYRDNQSDARLKLRFVALLMVATGIDLNNITKIIGKSIWTIERWMQQYLSKGIDSLNSFQYVPKKTFLNDEQVKQVVDWVRNTNPSKIKEVKQYIKDHFQITYSVEGVRKLLKKKVLN